MKRETAALALCLAVEPLSCVTQARSAARPPIVVEARWQDVFDVAPELLVVIRPNALRANELYGPLLKRVQQLAREQNPAVAATGAMEAIEDADEVLFGLYSIALDDADASDFVAVVLGVRADIDPATLVDTDGRALWTAGPSGPVRELLREHEERGPPVQASLFELPGRTWVIASGRARTHARDAFARPRGRPDPAPLDADTLALVRVDGPSLAARLPALRPPSPLAALGRGLRSVSLELPPDAARPVQASLAYSSVGAAAAAESVARDAVEAIRRKKPEGFEWIGDARISRPAAGSLLALSAPLPPRILVSLQRMGARAPESTHP